MASFTLTAGAITAPKAASSSAGQSRRAQFLAAPRQQQQQQQQQLLRRALRLACQAAKDPTLQLTEDERRWESQVRDGRVKNVTTRDVGEMMKDGWVLLDVRPEEEKSRVRVLGAVEVPVFVKDTETSLSSFIKHATAFGMGGWWLGGAHMVPNPGFMAEVLSQVPKDAKVVVACQKGLRSLAACETLSRAGYGQLAWINGGFDTAKPGDLPTKDGKDIRLAGIGGLSEFLGWTQIQRETSKNAGFAGGSENLLKILGVVLVVDLIWFGAELYQAYQANNIPGQ